ncbi:MAG: cysteine--tRNA ligase [Lysobacterales bacterium 69-70]|nr:cysteine--tRNA ligase [Xanthomonadaceae bacterium]ODU34799.1 MAG: cysteine--tRNA ligase [Xanthomonadaceae bacterium SCN 69-320]ODV19693.1 MAG: cysteine--tRNA ligase [Xanthomonadaceae bacterium SCN 69-25]OJY95052.1 MAG: cysteine--tRNA ligase [Xanthomonadales bacterium 69-70]
MNLRLHNSLTRRTEDFVPQDPNRVTVYACGPTVYNYVHIGNARPAVVFALLARLLRRHYPGVVYARNITDVDDKINEAARQNGVPIQAITERYAAAYRDDMARLGVDPPDVEPHVTTHIPQIIAMCEQLIANGHAYAAENHVLFDVASYADYGHLSGRSVEDMIAGARVEIAPYKKNPADFVLWKPSSDDLPGWDSPWGRGRPGWHIECSAMSEAHLGETIDIHAGGVDLQFPHHENEIAQSTCAHGGKIFARYWLHNGMLTLEGRKMSKSVGNTLVLHELLDLYPPEVLRFVLLKAHYRQPLDWSESALQQARATLDGWYGVLRDLAGVPAAPAEVPADFEAALLDDLNTPDAFATLAALADAARRSAGSTDAATAKGRLLAAAGLIGLLQQDPEAWFKQTAAGAAVDAAHVDALIAERNAARAARDFARADAIRTELTAMNITIEDGAQGTRWRVGA